MQSEDDEIKELLRRDRIALEKFAPPEPGIEVRDYKLFAGNGRFIRMATKVIFPDGKEIAFVDRLSKREALRAASEGRGRLPEAEAEPPGAPKPPPPRKKKPGWLARLTGTGGKISPEEIAKARERAKRLTP